MEEWKEVEDFPSYSISSFGNIKNNSTGRVLLQYIRNGYKTTGIYYKGMKKNLAIHRQVGLCFLNNTNNHPFINHIDGNKINNNVSNLEWCSPAENNEHARESGLNQHFLQPITQHDLNGLLINTFNSIKEAQNHTGISNKHISSVCRGKRKTTGGYIWKYKNKVDIQNHIPEGNIIINFPNYIITHDKQIYSKKRNQYLKQIKLPNGMLKVKLANNGTFCDVYIQKLYREYYET